MPKVQSMVKDELQIKCADRGCLVSHECFVFEGLSVARMVELYLFRNNDRFCKETSSDR